MGSNDIPKYRTRARAVSARRQLFMCATGAVLVCFVVITAAAQTPEQGARPNRDMFDAACRQGADSLLRTSGALGLPTVQLRFADGERTGNFRGVLTDAVVAAAGAVYTDGTLADTIVTLGVEQVSVAYGDGFRDGWFGEKRTQRTVTVVLRLEMQLRSSGRLLSTGALRSAVADTIGVDEIARLASSSRHIATGAAPSGSVWEKILEPAIITVSSGIAIYLFFTVRS